MRSIFSTDKEIVVTIDAKRTSAAYFMRHYMTGASKFLDGQVLLEAIYTLLTSAMSSLKCYE